MEDGQPNPFDMGRVEVPSTTVSLTNAQEQEIQAQFNPLALVLKMEGGQPNPFDMGRVEVPTTTVSLTNAQEQEIRAQFNPLANSDYNGFDLYLNVYDFCNQNSVVTPKLVPFPNWFTAKNLALFSGIILSHVAHQI